MFGQVGETELDVRFVILGIPVRIHPIFWLSSAMLAWAPERIDITLVRVAAILIAVLVHELGHALMNARFGFRSHIVLYILGGYATTTRHSTWRDIAVSLAGPMAGFLLLAAIYVPCRVSGYIVGWSFAPMIIDPTVMPWPEFFAPRELGAEFIAFSIFINLAWNVMNLMPVLPLDGGQISRELFMHRYRQSRKGMMLCLQLSLVSAGAIALYAFYQRAHDGSVLGLDPLFLGIMFGFLSFQSFQMLQQHRHGW